MPTATATIITMITDRPEPARARWRLAAADGRRIAPAPVR